MFRSFRSSCRSSALWSPALSAFCEASMQWSPDANLPYVMNNETNSQLTTWLSAQPFVSFITEVCYLTKIMTEIYAKDDRSPIWVTTAALISELGAGGHSTIGLGNIQGDNPRAGLACFHGAVDAETGNQCDSSHRIYFGGFGTIDFLQVNSFQSC